MPDYHPIYLTGETVTLFGEDAPVVLISTNYHHGGAVFHGFGRYTDNGQLEVSNRVISEYEFIDSQFGWDKVEESSVYDIRAEIRNSMPYAVVYLKKNAKELLVTHQPDNENYVNCMKEVADLRDAVMFANRYGFSVHGIATKTGSKSNIL